jgi:hypothetical protein
VGSVLRLACGGDFYYFRYGIRQPVGAWQEIASDGLHVSVPQESARNKRLSGEDGHGEAGI